MSTTQTTTLQESLTKISEKSGKPIAEVEAAYNSALSTVPASVKNEARRQKTALMIVNRDLTINTKSTAVAYQAVIIGSERTKDLYKNKHEYALKAYEENMEEALNTGLVRVDGDKVTVLDNRETVGGKPNKKFGQPLAANMFLRKLHALIRKPGEDNWTKGSITLWGDQAKLVVPLMKQVDFVANGDLKDGAYDLRAGVDTQFQIKEEMTDEDVISLIDDKYNDLFKDLSDTWSYHKTLHPDANGKPLPEFWDSLVITEGTVTWIQEFENSIKITLHDDSLNGVPFHERGVTCWLPKSLKHLITFGRKSIVTVVARTGYGDYYDTEKKMNTGDKVLQLTLLSIIGRPGLTTDPIEEGEQI